MGRWYDAALVRWFEGTTRPIGGWRRPSALAPPMAGTARGLFPWRDNGHNRWCAIGTHTNLYVFNGGAVYNITPAGLAVGRADGFYGSGFGFGPYSPGLYGSSPSTPPVIDATTWTFDNWGQYLVGCATTDGRLYQWTLGVSTPAAVISGAPTACLSTIVSAERYQFALGAGGDPRALQWCDQGDNTTWTPDALNTAGDLKLQTNGTIRAARRMRGEMVIWTDTDVHSVYYLGPPLVYGTKRLAGFCGLIGANAISIIDSGAVWMSIGGFFLYDGGAVQPIACEVWDYVLGGLNLVQSSKIYAGHNAKFGEVWWFYPSAASTENDRYVIWNYRENHWNIGPLSRLCWAGSGVFNYALAVDAAGYIYEHENGWSSDGAPLTSARYAKSGPVQMGPSGDRMLTVNQLVPDEVTQGQVNFQMRTKLTPEGQETAWGPFAAASYTDVRLTARQASLDVYGVADADWRLGNVRMDALPGSRR